MTRVFVIESLGGMLFGMSSFGRFAISVASLLCFVGCESVSVDDSPQSRTVPMTLCILHDGLAANVGEEARNEMLQGHHARRVELAQAGHLLLAGPFDRSREISNSGLRGLYVFDTGDLEQARAWAQSDPSVAGGLFRADLLPMNGPVALRRVNDLHVAMVEALPAEEQQELASGIAQYTVALGQLASPEFPSSLDGRRVVVRAKLVDGRDVAIFDEVDVETVRQRVGEDFSVYPWASTKALRDLGADPQGD
ncbi:MAG: YciI family protein [Planctomycetota bacterium]